MSKDSCILYPEVNGEPSKLYKNLLEKKGYGRPLTNWVYATYLSSNTAAAMDAAGYKRNLQGEHRMKDVVEFLKVDQMHNELSTLAKEEENIGAIDSNGNRVDFTDAKAALEKADNFNDSHTGLVANVYQHGNVYNIIVYEKNSKTHTIPNDIKQRLKIWEVEKHVFNNIGVDIDNMPAELNNIFSPFHTDLVQYLSNLQRYSIQNMYRKDALILFNMDPNSAPVQRLINSFGSLEDAAQAIDDINHGTGNYTAAQKTLLKRAITHCQKLQGLDLTAVAQQIKQMTQQLLSGNPEEEVKNTLHKLNKQFKIDINEIHKTDDKIQSLSDAAIEAAFQIERRIRELEKIKGNNIEGKRLEKILNQLMNELANKKYYSGIINFLSEANTQIHTMDTLFQSIPTTGTELEKAVETAKILTQVKDLSDQYYPIISALADEKIKIDESISQSDIDNIRQTAKTLKDFLDQRTSGIDNKLSRLSVSTMTDLVTQVTGNTAPNGQSIVNVVTMAAADSSMFEYLYSVGRVSNPIIATMGSIIRKAQASRDATINNISLRIRRATDELYKSGSDSSFMYEDDGHIISDIDWAMYKKARKGKIKELYKQGLKGFELKEALEDWEDFNTEDRVVDITNGRTERVPNYLYRKPFPQLTTAQQKYYDTMMQIKGEIGSLLPSYAQHQYLPPQVRRKFLDALHDAKSFKDVVNAFWNKVANFWTIREDDENYNTNGIIDGDEYKIVESDFNNTPLKQIPIFYINKVEQGELLKNFSTGLTALAGTAINYDVIDNVANAVEFIGDFAKNQMARDKDKKGDVVQNKQIRIFKDLWKWGKNNNTTALIDGYIMQHLYGQRRDPSENKIFSKLWGNIIAYTSFKGLSFNIKGAFSNYLVGEFQMLIEAGAGEFYGYKDYAWAHGKLFGGAGVAGELLELLTNNMNHKSTLFREMFDPINDNFSDKSHTKYYKSMFRQLVSHDCSFIGYSSGEYLIHYVNMYAVLHSKKVLLNGKEIPLYDAFEVTNKQNNNSELRPKAGVTQLNGDAITPEFIDDVRSTIRYVNQSTHGAMNEEDKGLLHQKWWGRGIANFRQWMVEHYSRRFRGRHFDDSLGKDREGYWVSFYKYLFNEDTKDVWNSGIKGKASVVGTTIGESIALVLPWFARDYLTFMLRAKTQWDNLDEMQRYNVKRVHSEMMMFIMLLGLSFALGEPEEHKKEWWRRWWIYQVRRLILDTEASMPIPQIISSQLTILQSPMASVNTLNSLLYSFYGLYNGDLYGPNSKIKSGKHKGENRYWRNMKKYNLPFFKDWEQLQALDEDEAIFQVFKQTPSNK